MTHDLINIMQIILIFAGLGLSSWVIYCVSKVKFSSRHFWACMYLLVFCAAMMMGMLNYHFNFGWRELEATSTLYWHPALYMAGGYIGQYANFLKHKIRAEDATQQSTLDEILLNFRHVTADLQRKERNNHSPIDILAAYITHLPLPAWIKANDGRMMAINESYTKAYGITLEQYNSSYDATNWGNNTASRFKKHDDIVLATHEDVFAYEEITNPITKQIQKLEVVKFPIWDGGEVVAVAGLVKGYVL